MRAAVSIWIPWQMASSVLFFSKNDGNLHHLFIQTGVFGTPGPQRYTIRLDLLNLEMQN
jgi:hypothetical protein